MKLDPELLRRVGIALRGHEPHQLAAISAGDILELLAFAEQHQVPDGDLPPNLVGSAIGRPIDESKFLPHVRAARDRIRKLKHDAPPS